MCQTLPELAIPDPFSELFSLYFYNIPTSSFHIYRQLLPSLELFFYFFSSDVFLSPAIPFLYLSFLKVATP